MGSTAQGNGGFRGAFRVNTEQDFDPKYGFITIETWVGIKSVIIALRNAWALAGWKSHITHRGPTWTVTVRFGADPAQTEAPIDQWKIDMEPVQVSIWSHPNFWPAMEAWGAGPGGFKKSIEDAIKNGLPLSGGIASIDTAQAIYRLLARGVEAYEIKRPVLSRVRTFSLSYSGRAVLNQVENVYTTAALKTAFLVPTAIGNLLPADPSTPPTGCAWAWKQRQLQADVIPALGKIQETMDWVFAAWSVGASGGTGLYNLISPAP